MRNTVTANWRMRRAAAALLVAALVLPVGPQILAAPGGRAGDAPLPAKRSAKIQKKWGIEIVAMRLSAAGSIIDFRYRVVDSDRAAFLTDRNLKAYLVDQQTGRVLEVPTTAKVGPLRQTTPYAKPEVDRIYFMLFGNPGKSIRTGSKMTLAIGDVKIKNLVVQ